MHYQFEAIPPFLDGNGRIGRLLIAFFLSEREFLSQPLLYLSAFFEKFRDDYYSKLISVSQKGEWKEWVEFFLRGIISQSKEGAEDAKKLLNLHSKYQHMIQETKKIPESAQRLIDEIFLNPVISIAALSKRWNVSFNSVKVGVKRLVEVGVLREMGEKKRNKLFIAPELMALLLGPER